MGLLMPPAVLNSPSTSLDNLIQPTNDATAAITLKRHSVTQTAPHLQCVDETGLLLTQLAADGSLAINKFTNAGLTLQKSDSIAFPNVTVFADCLLSSLETTRFAFDPQVNAITKRGSGGFDFWCFNPSAPVGLQHQIGFTIEQVAHIQDDGTFDYNILFGDENSAFNGPGFEGGAASANRVVFGGGGTDFDGQLTVICNTAGTKGITIKAAGAQTAPLIEWRNSAAVLQMSVAANGRDWILDTSVGTQWGTVGGAAGQKQSWWGAPPTTQPLFATGAGHTVDQLIAVLQTIGFLRQT